VWYFCLILLLDFFNLMFYRGGRGWIGEGNNKIDFA
jgi:hypothetical protein